MYDWPHSPSRLVTGPGSYMVTASTYHKVRLFDTNEKLDRLTQLLLENGDRLGWSINAWAVFENHYHVIAFNPEYNASVRRWMSTVHTKSSSFLNELDEAPGRRVWFSYRDTKLTFERSYYARLAYVHNNPVKHQLVKRARDYAWCSAGWFETRANPTLFKTVSSFPFDDVKIEDDF